MLREKNNRTPSTYSNDKLVHNDSQLTRITDVHVSGRIEARMVCFKGQRL